LFLGWDSRDHSNHPSAVFSDYNLQKEKVPKHSSDDVSSVVEKTATETDSSSAAKKAARKAKKEGKKAKKERKNAKKEAKKAKKEANGNDAITSSERKVNKTLPMANLTGAILERSWGSNYVAI
jgi:sRNA-binding protein